MWFQTTNFPLNKRHHLILLHRRSDLQATRHNVKKKKKKQLTSPEEHVVGMGVFLDEIAQWWATVHESYLLISVSVDMKNTHDALWLRIWSPKWAVVYSMAVPPLKVHWVSHAILFSSWLINVWRSENLKCH